MPKEQISVRLDPEVLARLREAGPGWQSRINTLLRTALGLAAVPADATPKHPGAEHAAAMPGRSRP